MFFEIGALIKTLNKNKQKEEKFTEEKPSGLYANVMLIFTIIYLLVVLVLWIRVVMSAFQCGTMEGFSSLIFPSLYSLYKFGDLIKLSCNQLY